MPGAGLRLATGTEHAGMAQAVGRLEVVVGLVENEERLVLHLAEALLEAGVERLDALGEGRRVGLVALCVGRVGGGQVSGHALGDDQGVGWQQPQVRIERARPMVMVVLVGMGGLAMCGFVMLVSIMVMAVVIVVIVVIVMFSLVVRVRITKTTQSQFWHVLHRYGRAFTSAQCARQEALQIRADPVEQLRIADTPYVGRSQRVMMRRSAGRQQNVRLTDAILNRRGDQLQRLDAGQHADFGVGGRGASNQRREQGKGKKTIHGRHSYGGNWYIITSLPQHVAAHVQDPAGLYAPRP